MADTDSIRTYGWYADGAWHEAGDRPLFDDIEPYTGEVYARVADCGPEETKIAIKAAADAFPAWAATPPAEKARLFFKAAEIVRRRRNEIAEELARETGSTIPFSIFQQDLVASTLEQAASWVYLPKGEVLQSNLPDTHSIGVRRPLGVVASFTPWNGANILGWRAVLNPLAAGCTVVVKPSEFAPISAGLTIAEIAHEGLVYQPTILTGVPREAVADREETFGPLVIVEPVDTPEEAVAVANRVQYGLTSSILGALNDGIFEATCTAVRSRSRGDSRGDDDSLRSTGGGGHDGVHLVQRHELRGNRLWHHGRHRGHQ